MRTLSTSFQTALKKDQNRKHAMIFRVEAEEVSSGDSKVFYFSNDWEEIDYTAVSGIIARYGTIKQTIDFYSNSYSYGGFDLSIVEIQDKINDLLKDNYVINRKVEIYYWIEGQDKRTNQDIVFDDARLVADSNILDGATDFEIEMILYFNGFGRQSLVGKNGNTAYQYALFYESGAIYVGAQAIRLETDTNGDRATWNIGILSGDEHTILFKKISEFVWELFIDDVSYGQRTTTDGSWTIDQIGYGTINYLDASVRSIKIWSGGDRNTGTLECDLVGKDDAPLDLTGNYTFTKYVSGAGDITYSDNLLRYYKGIISDKRNEDNQVVLEIENDTAKLEKQIPDLIDDDDAGDANGKVAQLVYGSHSTNYGTYDSRPKNNMVKCEYCGIVDDKYRWIVGGNGSDISLDNAWFFNSTLNRYVEIISYDSGTDAQGNKYIEITPEDGYITDCYDYIYGKLVTETGTSPVWGEDSGYAIENSIDNSTVSATRVSFDNEYVNTNLKISFNDTNNYTINSIYAYYKVSSSNESVFVLSGSNFSEIDISTRTVYNEEISGLTSLPTYINFICSEFSEMAVGNAYVYYAYLRANFELTEIGDLYVECSNDIDTQKEVIEDLCDKADISYIDNADVSGITMAPILDTQKNAIDHIQEVAFQGACVAFVNNDNELSVDQIDITATADKVLYPNDVQVGSLEVEETSLSELVNSININYGDDNNTGGSTEISTSENTTSQSKYNITKEKVINADFYQADPTELKAYWVNGNTETAFTKKRAIFTLRTCGIVGSHPYDASGNFEPLCLLEQGDHISLDASFDNYKKCNNESWDGKVFKIIGKQDGIGYMELKGLEVS